MLYISYINALMTDIYHMKKLNDFEKFSANFRKARLAAGLNQEALAKKINASRDMIVRIERGDNVGIHSVLSALHVLGQEINVGLRIPESAKVVSNFDAFYQENIRNKLESDLKNNPSADHGFVQKSQLKSARVRSWSNASKI